MILDARQPEKPAGVLVDHGTGKRIPFARKVNFDTGEYEALVPAGPNLEDYLYGDDGRPVVVRGKAVGRLELVPVGKAVVLGIKEEPKPITGSVEPVTAEQKLAGLDQYKQVYFKVWNGIRGEANRCVNERWSKFIDDNDFLDSFILKRKITRTEV